MHTKGDVRCQTCAWIGGCAFLDVFGLYKRFHEPCPRWNSWSHARRSELRMRWGNWSHSKRSEWRMRWQNWTYAKRLVWKARWNQWYSRLR